MVPERRAQPGRSRRGLSLGAGAEPRGCFGLPSRGPGRRGQLAAAPGPRRPPSPSRSPPSSSRTSFGKALIGAEVTRAARSPRASLTGGETLSRSPREEEEAPGRRRTSREPGPALRAGRQSSRRRPSQVCRRGWGGRAGPGWVLPERRAGSLAERA